MARKSGTGGGAGSGPAGGRTGPVSAGADDRIGRITRPGSSAAGRSRRASVTNAPPAANPTITRSAAGRALRMSDRSLRIVKVRPQNGFDVP